MRDEDPRPDPEELLARLGRSEEPSGRGKLKVFLGANAGVGKTCAMLDAAHEARRGGRDVVVGWVETHGRVETAARLAGLEVIPPRLLPHGPRRWAAFDLDATLSRQPAVVLVDELAHSNVAGMRHAKRWQDVDELRAAGIDVWTTLNVQHLESLVDVVAAITGVEVRETVPDGVLADAQFELVDLPPEELLARLAAGKVYAGPQADRAAEGFFQLGNLVALRELALRRATERVEADVLEFRDQNRVTSTWEVGERILVALGPSTDAASLVRAGARLAAGLRAPWLVTFIETPRTATLSDGEREVVWKALRLAESLGAEVVSLSGEDAAAEIVALARRRNTNRVVLGRPQPGRAGLRKRSGMVDALFALAPTFDVVLVPTRHNRRAARAAAAAGERRLARSPWTQYLLALVPVVLVTLVAWPLRDTLERTDIAMFFLLAVLGSALRCGRGPSWLASAAAVVCFDVVFVPPYGSFHVADARYLMTFAVLFVVANVVSSLAVRLSRQVVIARRREHRSLVGWALARELAAARSLDQALAAALPHLWEEFSSQVLLLLPGPDGRLEARAKEAVTYQLDAREVPVAEWVFHNGKPAGRTTDTLPRSKGFYLPLRVGERTVGVLGLHPAAPELLLDPEIRHFLESLAGQLALAIGHHAIVHHGGATQSTAT